MASKHDDPSQGGGQRGGQGGWQESGQWQLDPPLVGHEAQQDIFLQSLHGPRMHHAWLLHGPKGIGKARFAAQAAAYTVAPAARVSDTQLDVDLAHPDIRLVRQGAHPDVMWLDRWTGLDRKKVPKQIPVATVRAAMQKMHGTAAYEGWRVMVIDAVDDLNVEGANALLKPLEEPPRKTVLFLVAHAINRVLPTIRSRCRKLAFAPLPDAALRPLVATDDDAKRALVTTLAEGRAGQAIRLLTEENTLALYIRFCELAVAGGTRTNGQADRLAFAAALAALPDDSMDAFLALLDDWFSRRAKGEQEPAPLTTPPGTLDRAGLNALGESWSAMMQALALRRAINLDTSETIMTLFVQLDEVYTHTATA